MLIDHTALLVQRRSLSLCALWLPRLTSTIIRQYSTRTPLPRPPLLHDVPAPETADAVLIKNWADLFQKISVTELRGADGVKCTFSRSSGPGGQNVNKVNTKVTLRCDIDSSWVPKWAAQDFIKDPHYVKSSHSLLVTSTFTRSQAQNIDDCLGKLKNLILSTALARVRNPTSAETQKRVSGLMKADKERRKTDKAHKSNVKQHRSQSKRSFGFD
ncbi:RF-1 domain-containing protein [Coprinopsis sp. MPI-PUGE-AT-0042]|nr:RF-1 domain-containing protein [Coprinopsis sp. MPI-PUGE-AT-0042]